MKKILLFFFCLIFLGISKAQHSDTLIRAAGFYFSPAVTAHLLSNVKKNNDPVFGGSFGFRFINKIYKGFFIEGGVGIGIFGGKQPEEEKTWTQCNYFEPSVIFHYTEQCIEKEINWLVPFLIGYKTISGKVRFQGSVGIAFALRNYIFKNYTVTDGINPYFGDGHSEDNYPYFGTSFYAIARAGISIPVKKRINIEILPAARYRMFYFTSDRLDLIQNIKSSESPWSLGIDIGLMFSINNKKSEEIDDKDLELSDEQSYTMRYDEPDTLITLKKNKVNKGPKNAVYIELGGNGMFYSLNYERTFFSKNIVNIQARAGVGYAAGKYAIPIGGNFTIGTSRKKFEAGLTCTLGNFNLNSEHQINRYDTGFDAFGITLDPSIAFRFESKQHLFLRFAVLTHYFPLSGGLLPGFGISVGGCF